MAEAKQEVNLNDKFNSLIKKIEFSKKQANNLDQDGENNNQEFMEEEEQYNKDKALKVLYDESVEFKNGLADLRSKIKTMNTLFNSYDNKCSTLIEREFDEYKSLKAKLEAEKKRIEDSDILSDKKMNERSNRLKVM